MQVGKDSKYLKKGKIRNYSNDKSAAPSSVLFPSPVLRSLGTKSIAQFLTSLGQQTAPSVVRVKDERITKIGSQELPQAWDLETGLRFVHSS